MQLCLVCPDWLLQMLWVQSTAADQTTFRIQVHEASLTPEFHPVLVDQLPQHLVMSGIHEMPTLGLFHQIISSGRHQPFVAE